MKTSKIIWIRLKKIDYQNDWISNRFSFQTFVLRFFFLEIYNIFYYSIYFITYFINEKWREIGWTEISRNLRKIKNNTKNSFHWLICCNHDIMNAICFVFENGLAKRSSHVSTLMCNLMCKFVKMIDVSLIWQYMLLYLLW